MKNIFIIAWIFLWVLTPAVGGTKRLDSKQQKLHEFMQHIHDVMQFNGEILINQSGQVIFNESIGWASKTWSVPNKVNNKYLIASLTKSFTAALILKAVEQGTIQLKDHANQYLPDLDKKFKDVTIGQLLKHESGLTHYQTMADYWSKQSKLMMSNEAMLALINSTTLEFTPGTSVNYSSFGYYLLGLILEEIHQQSFENILKEEILEPLQMKQTGSANTLNIIEQLNDGYHIKPDHVLVRAPHRNYSSLKASGDLYSSATDLLKWHQALLEHKVLKPETMAGLFRSGNNSIFGMGWKHSEVAREKYYHGGGTWGYSAYQAIYPESDTSVIILANVSSLAVDGLAESIEHIIFEHDTQSMPSKITQVSAMHQQQPISDIAGKYQSTSSSRTLSIRQHNNQWYAQMAENPPFLIVLNDQGKYYGSKVDVTFTFVTSEEGMETVIAERLGQQYEFRKEQ